MTLKYLPKYLLITVMISTHVHIFFESCFLRREFNFCSSWIWADLEPGFQIIVCGEGNSDFTVEALGIYRLKSKRSMLTLSVTLISLTPIDGMRRALHFLRSFRSNPSLPVTMGKQDKFKLKNSQKIPD